LSPGPANRETRRARLLQLSAWGYAATFLGIPFPQGILAGFTPLRGSEWARSLPGRFAGQAGIGVQCRSTVARQCHGIDADSSRYGKETCQATQDQGLR